MGEDRKLLGYPLCLFSKPQVFGDITAVRYFSSPGKTIKSGAALKVGRGGRLTRAPKRTMLPISQMCLVLHAHFQLAALQIAGGLEGQTKHSSTVQTIEKREHTIILQKGGGQKTYTSCVLTNLKFLPMVMCSLRYKSKIDKHPNMVIATSSLNMTCSILMHCDLGSRDLYGSLRELQRPSKLENNSASLRQ